MKFIFATTEIRKVPVTILSRCQRFDLRRVPAEALAAHLGAICEKESIAAEAEAITAIARAAEGSVRDSLSLLDQAAAMTADSLTADGIAEMLGRPGRRDSIAILTSAMAGDSAAGLAALASAMANGAEPEMIIADLLDLVHRASLKAAGGTLEELLDAEKAPVAALAEQGIARLGRAWQMLLKGHAEVTGAPHPAAAAEMLIIRLSHLASMPTPGEIVRKLADSEPGSPSQDSAPSPAPDQPAATPSVPPTPPAPTTAVPEMTEPPATDPQPPRTMMTGGPAEAAIAAPQTPQPQSQPRAQPRAQPQASTRAQPEAQPQPQSIHDIAALAESQDDLLLAALIRNHVRPVKVQPGLLEISLTDGAPDSLPGDIARQLSRWTGTRWMVSLAEGAGGRTVAEERQAARQQQRDALAETPLVKSILATFPGAEIEAVKPAEQPDEDPTHDA